MRDATPTAPTNSITLPAMSTVEKPSEQLQVLLDSHKDYAAGDFEAFADRYAEVCKHNIDAREQYPLTATLTARQDFTRENLPSSMKWPGMSTLGENSKAEFLSRMQFGRTHIYNDDFKVGQRAGANTDRTAQLTVSSD